jgi:hypothetical protein
MTTLRLGSDQSAASGRVAHSGCEVRLRLLPSGDGWSLVSPDGKLVFHALGTAGRRRCLETARARGVLAIR